MVTRLLAYREQSPKGTMRNSEFNWRVNLFPVFIFIFCYVFLSVSVEWNRVCPPNAPESELLEVLFKNRRFLELTTDVLNQSVWRRDLVICVLNTLPCGFLCILRFENPAPVYMSFIFRVFLNSFCNFCFTSFSSV